MPIVWPVELPIYVLVRGYSEAIADNTHRSGVDAGPAKVRPKGGLIPFPMTVSMECSSEQGGILENFIQSTLIKGTLRFEWTHPRSLEIVEVRFLPSSGKMASIVPVGPVSWEVSFSLEVLP